MPNLDVVLNRREFSSSFALAGVATVVPGGLGLSLGEGALSEPDPAGGLAVWLRDGPDGTIRASIGLALDDRSGATRWRTIGPESIELAVEPLAAPGEGVSLRSWDTRLSACRRARDLLVATAARLWRVPATECATAQGRIVHAATGREVGYRIWAGIA